MLNLAETLRLPLAAIPAVLTAAFLAAPLAELEQLRAFFVRSSADLIGAESRALILEAVSAAIITCGERADACATGSRANLAHLRRMAAVDDLGTALLEARARAA